MMLPLQHHSEKEMRVTNSHKNDHRTLWGYFDHEIKWFNVCFLLFIHLYALKIYSSIRVEHVPLIFWALFTGSIGGFGVTGGAHRYFTHKSFKAKLPLRIILMLAYTSAGQNKLFDWVRDHRVHHKFSETDADPHNSRRGFFFAHCGWLMMKKHPDVITKGKTVDCNDVLGDPVVQFHQKYFWPLRISLCFILPTLIPMFFWGWDLQTSFETTFGKWITLLHCTWAVNSVAHLWGSKPYNKDIYPVETKIVSFLSMGEGWHNYHHTFPWDYKASEFSYNFNATTFWIDVFAKIGWAYDLKQPSDELVKKTIKKLGDGSHFKWKEEVEDDKFESDKTNRLLCE